MARNRSNPRRPNQGPRQRAVPLPAEGEPALAQPGELEGASIEQAFALLSAQLQPPVQKLQEVMGYPVVSYFIENAAIADEQVLHLYEHLRRIGHQERIGLWINSRGGATEVPWKVVSLFREYADAFTVLVPYRAHSSATLICLGADELVLTPMSELGPVDPSRRHPLLPAVDNPDGSKAPITVSVQDLRHVLEFLQRQIGNDLPPEVAAQVYTALFDHVHPLAMGALEQSWALANQIGTQVLSTRLDDEDEISRIVERFADYYKSHLYQINRNEAREIGLPVRDATADEADAMWNLYLAYSSIQFAGEADMGAGEPAVLTGIGHIDSAVGNTIGFGIALKSNPGNALGARWQSSWHDQQAAPATPAAEPQPNA